MNHKIFNEENDYSNFLNNIQVPVPIGLGGFQPGDFQSGMMIPNFPNNPMITGFIPSSMMLQNSGQIQMDSLLQSHKRKLEIRTTNRRSAKLARARKKVYIEELKDENFRLQAHANILESQPDFIFCVNIEGHINYVSDKTKCSIKNGDSQSHMNQILTNDSFNILLESLNQLKRKSLKVSLAKEIQYYDSNGYPSVGYLRCSRLVRKYGMGVQDDSDSNPTSASSQHAIHKRSKQGSSSSSTQKNSCNIKDINKTSLSSLNIKNTSSNSQLSVSDHNDEFVCIITPAESNPVGTSVLVQLHSSTESMVEHDCKTDRNDFQSNVNSTNDIKDVDGSDSGSCSLSDDSALDD